MRSIAYCIIYIVDMATNSPIAILTIAGSDPSGGAGIQADLKTISALGAYGMSVITAITAQNTVGVRRFQALDPSLVADQLEMVLSDIPPMAIKTGMLASAPIAEAVAGVLRNYRHIPLVVDPVMVATSGDQLIDSDAISAVVEHIFPIATLITPNVNEARKLTAEQSANLQSAKLHQFGTPWVLLKGGDHVGSDKTDVLTSANGGVWQYTACNVDTRNTHGTGCTMSAAIATYIARNHEIPQAVGLAKDYITNAIKYACGWTVGHGHGPVNHYIDSNVNPNETFR